MMDSLDRVLARHAVSRPDQIAYVCDGRRVTFGELRTASDTWARALHTYGVGVGARVAYLGKDSVDFVVLLYACAKAGIVLVPVNWRLAPAERAYLLNHSEAELLFIEDEFIDAESRTPVADRPLPMVILTSTPQDDDSARPKDAVLLGHWLRDAPDTTGGTRAHRSDADTPVVQMYTSGTTGFPKGVVLAHRSFFAVREALDRSGLDWIDWRPDDVSLVCAPASHIGGLWWTVQGVNAGVTSLAMRVFGSREAVELMEGYGVTTMCLAPAMLTMLLREPERSDATFRRLRKVVYGGSPIPEVLLRRCMETMDCEFVQIYGLTETGNTAVCLPPADHLRDTALLQAAGRPYPGVGLRIVDDDGAELPAGEVGEVCVRSPAQMVEYWRAPDATDETVVDGWVRTGDAGYLDGDGYLYISDRFKDMIIRAGENIFPAEIEGALAAHPAVADCAVVGIPDERWGEAVLAFVVPGAGAAPSPRELRTFLRERIADYKVPTAFRVVEDLPRSAIGKVLRRTLRAPFWAGRSRHVN
ncbi:long-chain-fatty-acid--CoA ligase [Streptomyces olivaceoviridis]|uniref:long-chain-fatty-acid--CoA ligase n=1 Tax=Streptomyces olivaceoviridis TaxID=1921 RepID=UPI0016730172|nr:long-chain-fatty-acid--CoA ligase [Streptomyces olivaceoviridis]